MIEDQLQGAESQDADRALAQALKVDHMTAGVLRALQLAGVEPLLLKGPAIVSALYRDGATRMYHDCDLLVSPEDVATAERVLSEQGFERFVMREAGFAELEEGHAHAWVRAGDDANVDLHHRFAFTAPEHAAANWERLNAGTRTIRVAEVPVRVLDEPGIALLVAVHPAQHGPHGHVIADLERALAGFDGEAWAQAARLAHELGIEAALATGLQMRSQGEWLARELGLRLPTSIEGWLTIRSSPAGAIALQRLLRTPGLRGKLAFAITRLFPSAEFMRETRPIARRGRGGLTVAYASRLASIAVSVCPALWSWLGASRSASRSA